MADAERTNQDSAYWRALQERVCAVCLDRHDDGSCQLPNGRVCGVKRHLPLIADVVHNVDSSRMDDYVAAVERSICKRCPEQDAAGHCTYREKASCALYAYLPLVLDAIDAADEARR
jgi:hypothetical protein